MEEGTWLELQEDDVTGHEVIVERMAAGRVKRKFNVENLVE